MKSPVKREVKQGKNRKKGLLRRGKNVRGERERQKKRRM
jgi:hypothetical protein